MVNKQVDNNITILRKGATSALAGFHAGSLSWLNWNLEILVFMEGGKPENLEKKNPEQGKNQQQTQPLYAGVSLEAGYRRYTAVFVVTN